MSSRYEKHTICDICYSCPCHSSCSRQPGKRSSRPRWLRYCLFIVLFAVTTSYWAVTTYVHTSQEHESFPTAQLDGNETCHWCTIDVPKERREWPAVGYDLTESYGTATIKFPTGEIINIGPIVGDENYKNAMHKLSLASSKHTAPPYNWYWDPPGGPIAGMWDIPRRWWRSLRKSYGFPASPEVGAISTVLSSLLSEANALIHTHNRSQHAGKAVITTPDLLALYDEDIYDIANYAGLDAADTIPYLSVDFPKSLLTTFRFGRQPKYIDSAMMGYGIGLCRHPEVGSICGEEDAKMPVRDLVMVYVSRRAIDIECNSWRRSAFTKILYYQQHPSFFNPSLGLDGKLDDKNEAWYWARVNALLQDCMRTIGSWQNVTDVLLVGEMAGDERVEREVKKMIMKRPQMIEPKIYAEDMVFVSSKGAAEMAARILWTPDECGFDEPKEGRKLCRKQ